MSSIGKKVASQVDKLISAEVINTIVQKLKDAGEWPELDFQSPNVTENLEKIVDDWLKQDSPKRSPKKNAGFLPKWLEPEEFLDSVKANPDTIVCHWRRKNGKCKITGKDTKNKICAAVVNDDKYKENNYKVRCPECQRNNSERANESLRQFFSNLTSGSEVKITPTVFSIEENTTTAAEDLGGLRDGMTSPERWANGGDHEVSPTDAMTKEKKSLNFRVKPIGVFANSDDHKDYINKFSINECTWIIREINGSENLTVIGKIEGSCPENLEEDYMETLIPLDSEDKEELSKYEAKYLFKGISSPIDALDSMLQDLEIPDEN